MTERSKRRNLLKESRRWWKCGSKGFAEWTHEGGPKSAKRVGVDGIPSRRIRTRMIVRRDFFMYKNRSCLIVSFCPYVDESLFFYRRFHGIKTLRTEQRKEGKKNENNQHSLQNLFVRRRDAQTVDGYASLYERAARSHAESRNRKTLHKRGFETGVLR